MIQGGVESLTELVGMPVAQVRVLLVSKALVARRRQVLRGMGKQMLWRLVACSAAEVRHLYLQVEGRAIPRFISVGLL